MTLSKRKNRYGAVEKTRTSTGYDPTTTSTLRVYQFRHDRLISVYPKPPCESQKHSGIAKGKTRIKLLSASRERMIPVMKWHLFNSLAMYQQTLSEMQALATAIRAGTAPESIWLLEHPPLYTAGTSAKPQDLLKPAKWPVYPIRRGGQYTYHGPGQRVIYLMLDLKKRTPPGQAPDIRHFVKQVEQWMIDTLAVFSVKGERRPGRVGIWVDMTPYGEPETREKKIAALGIGIRQGVTLHGVSINLNPNLSHYEGIIPCGISQYGVTSLHDLGITATMTDLDAALRKTFPPIFGN